MEDNYTTPENEGGIVQRIKESPRTVSALIIILIVAAAIYAFSGPNQEPTESPTEGDEVAVDTTTHTPEQSPAVTSPISGSPRVTLSPTPRAAGTTTSPQPTATAPLPEPSRTDSAFVEVAQRGDGVTHLARRAAGRWIQENRPDYEVKKEHLIYIEDYIKDQVGSKTLAVGTTQEISFDMIRDAVEHAKGLSEPELKNLSRYTSALP